VNFEGASVVVDEAKLAEPVHEKAHVLGLPADRPTDRLEGTLPEVGRNLTRSNASPRCCSVSSASRRLKR
jgi:hypothetical protein